MLLIFLFLYFCIFCIDNFFFFFSSLLQRIGNLTNGARDIKRHPYFAKYDFQALLHKDVEVPWIPPISDSYDGSNFRKQSTSFELQIDEDDGVKSGGWSDSF